MGDIATVWDPVNGRGDWAVSAADLAIDNTLETAVLISLFTDAQADPDDEIPDAVPGQPPNRRGWWADPTMGSKIWLRMRSKLSVKIATQVKADIQKALQWLIDDGVAASITVVTQITPPSRLDALITIFKSDGTQESFAYDWAWKGLL